MLHDLSWIFQSLIFWQYSGPVVSEEPVASSWAIPTAICWHSPARLLHVQHSHVRELYVGWWCPLVVGCKLLSAEILKLTLKELLCSYCKALTIYGWCYVWSVLQIWFEPFQGYPRDVQRSVAVHQELKTLGSYCKRLKLKPSFFWPKINIFFIHEKQIFTIHSCHCYCSISISTRSCIW